MPPLEKTLSHGKAKLSSKPWEDSREVQAGPAPSVQGWRPGTIPEVLGIKKTLQLATPLMIECVYVFKKNNNKMKKTKQKC